MTTRFSSAETKMKTSLIIIKIVFVLLNMLLFDSISFAEVQSAPQPAQSNAIKGQLKKATLSFEDELVEGGTQKPELFYLFQKKNFNYKRLIRLRENFLPEMRKTAEEIQRARSGS
jgi:hypothetical protein